MSIPRIRPSLSRTTEPESPGAEERTARVAVREEGDLDRRLLDIAHLVDTSERFYSRNAADGRVSSKTVLDDKEAQEDLIEVEVDV